ncbi:hypothetical protein HW132_31815 [Brasilonema sp. CT11]|nr:hypothetical protein [Brasilonema sp. CT11]
MYHFSVAYDKGKATDTVKYFAARENQDLGVVKALRKPFPKLDLSHASCIPLDKRAILLTCHGCLPRLVDNSHFRHTTRINVGEELVWLWLTRRKCT